MISFRRILHRLSEYLTCSFNRSYGNDRYSYSIQWNAAQATISVRLHVNGATATYSMPESSLRDNINQHHAIAINLHSQLLQTRKSQ
jgi:hypothetical protein